MGPEFDLRNLHRLPLKAALPRIGQGWLAQFRGRSWLSHAIQYGTGGPHSHSGMLRRTGDGGVDLLEVREWYGGRMRPFAIEAQRYKGRIDLFSPNEGGRWRAEFDADKAAEYMAMLCGLNYGYWSVAAVGLRRLPLVWRFFPIDTRDVVQPVGRRIRPFCSHAVCLAYQRGGHVDPVPRLPNYLVAPNDLTRSLFFRYEFTV